MTLNTSIARVIATRATRPRTAGGKTTTRHFARIALLAVGLLAGIPACGGSAKVQIHGTVTSSIPADLLAAWSTTVKMAVDDLVGKHVTQGASKVQRDSAAKVVTTICASALDDLRMTGEQAETLRQGCEAALRAAGAPRTSAAPIYEKAYSAFDSAGSLASLSAASEASQARVARSLLAPYDPNSTDLTSVSQRKSAGDGLKPLCTFLGVRASPCRSLVRELQNDISADPTVISKNWRLLQRD